MLNIRILKKDLSPGLRGLRGEGFRVWGSWVTVGASPTGLVVVAQPETVHVVPGGSQREGRLTFFTAWPASSASPA